MSLAGKQIFVEDIWILRVHVLLVGHVRESGIFELASGVL
jgi:hypothetical protein